MKKIMIFICALLSFFPSFVYALEADVTPSAKAAVMIDYDTGEVLYQKNMNDKRSVASLTKMMGLILIFENIESGALKTNEIIKASKNAKEMGGSQIWLEEGEKISVDDLLKGITMASANDAMVLMAERVSGTENAFVSLMNKKAKELGLKNTVFKNCTGLDEQGAYSSAYDMAIIAKELVSHKKVLDYTSKYEAYIRENTDNKTWITNTNKLVKFYKGVDGLKTGYEDSAGSTIAVTALKDGLRVIAVCLGYSDSGIRNNETMDLLDYGFNQYESKTLLTSDKPITSINVTKADVDKVDLYLKEDLKITNKKGEKTSDKYSYRIELEKFNYPIKKGDKIGVLYLKNNGNNIKSATLISNRDINKASFFKQYLKVLSKSLSGS